MSAAPAPAASAEGAPKKSKKMLFIILGVVVVLALAGAGAAFFILKKNTAQPGDGEEAETVVEHKAPEPGIPPTFLPLDSMVVNLADPGGNRVVQLAITLQVQDTKVGDAIKAYMPSIRNGILLLVSQRTADTILKPEGKKQLAQAILEEISGVMGYEIDEREETTVSGQKKRRRAPPNPLQGVLFSSFIVQ